MLTRFEAEVFPAAPGRDSILGIQSPLTHKFGDALQKPLSNTPHYDEAGQELGPAEFCLAMDIVLQRDGFYAEFKEATLPKQIFSITSKLGIFSNTSGLVFAQ